MYNQETGCSLVSPEEITLISTAFCSLVFTKLEYKSAIPHLKAYLHHSEISSIYIQF